MKIESPKRVISSDCESIFNFLMDMNNFSELFPKDKIEDWVATEETCTFKIKGMSDIGLKRVASKPNSLIYLDSYGKVPFKFTLNLFLSPINDNQSEVYLVFDGEVNPFMKMMLEKPLTSFFNGITEKLNTKYS